MPIVRIFASAVLALATLSSIAHGQSLFPDDIDRSTSALRGLLERFAADHGNIERFHDVPASERDREARRAFFAEWRERLPDVTLDSFSADERVDWILLRNELDYRLHLIDREAAEFRQIAELIPFAPALSGLEDSRLRLEDVDGKAAAATLASAVETVKAARERLSATGDDIELPGATQANRTARQVDRLSRALDDWYRFYDGYDPIFSWWTASPMKRIKDELASYVKRLREIAGTDDEDTIVGEPIGRDALMAELAHEVIAYTPEELIKIGKREFEWCDREMARASRDLGFGDDWRAAQNHVKDLHVEPGRQPALIRDLALEATRFIEERNLMTIPSLCKSTWRMEMMTPERQRVNPYFTGGEVISVSFPKDSMAHEDKLMSMRGNNVHFSRATVHHELIPGHHLQGFMTRRHRTHRRIFRTPFWVEGWALYWELRLWDLDFPRSAEDRVGMLFWRKHRCARILFSLGYHLGQMSTQECIDFLVERVGHERRNAEGEVRRSVIGGYSPLYQCAYLVGGLQIRALHREIVGEKKMTEREFHDAVLRQNAIPIELIRASLTGRKLEADHEAEWRFAE